MNVSDVAFGSAVVSYSPPHNYSREEIACNTKVKFRFEEKTCAI